MDYVRLNILVFLCHFIKHWSYNNAIKDLQELYKCKNFRIYLFWMNIWIIQDKDSVKLTFSKKANAMLTFPNSIFFDSHYHPYGIGNIQVDGKLWEIIHNGLSRALNNAQKNGRLEKIMDSHKNILFGKYGFQYSMTDVLEEYVSAVWSEFCFGKIQHNTYVRMRVLYLSTIRSTFYNHSTNLIPIFRSILCKIRRFTYRNEYKLIDHQLTEFIDNCPIDSFIGNFKLKLEENPSISNISNINDINNIVLDNTFLSVLVLDFIYMVSIEAILQVADKNIPSINRHELKLSAMTRGYLFPWRMRRMGKSNGIFRKGDYILANLHGVGLFFSSGPRSCIGPGMFAKFYNHLLKLLEPYNLIMVSTNPIVRHANSNTPFIISKHIVRLDLNRNHLANVLQFSKHKGIEKFYHVDEILRDPCLVNYIVWKLADICKTFAGLDGIISAEDRGWLFASPVAHGLGIPLYIARKANKLPGKVVIITYKKNGYDNEETLEISDDIKDKKMVIIDDGIASGNTTKALYDLVNTNNNVLGILSIIKHHYIKCEYNPIDNNLITLFDL